MSHNILHLFDRKTVQILQILIDFEKEVSQYKFDTNTENSQLETIAPIKIFVHKLILLNISLKFFFHYIVLGYKR